VTQRIVYITESLVPGGVQSQIETLADALAGDEFEPHVCFLNRGGSLGGRFEREGIATSTIAGRGLRDFFIVPRLKRHLARLRPDILHTWHGAGSPIGIAAATAAAIDRTVITVRRADPRAGSWQRYIDRRRARRAGRIVVEDAALRDFYVAEGWPADRFTVIPCGVSPVEESRSTRAELLAELQLPEDARLIGVAGSLVPRKRLKDVIWAAELVYVLHKNVHLLIFGDGPERAALERFVWLLRGEDRFHILGRRDDLPRFLPHLDVFWSGSENAGTPLAMLEAMAAGVPVVASGIPAHRRIVVDGETGYLAALGGRADFGRATDRIFRDEQLARRLGEAGRARVAEHFPAAAMLERYIALYRDLTG
jgi:glycosyltransferase involved in cell wall biosynthesis